MSRRSRTVLWLGKLARSINCILTRDVGVDELDDLRSAL